MTLIDPDRPENWPVEILAVLNENYDLLVNWESGSIHRDARAYDQTMSTLFEALRAFGLRGWHCSRLTDAELDAIATSGLQLPDASMLHRRIDALVSAGTLNSQISDVLKARNQADASNRAGIVWFCFYAPRIAGESGIGRFFRHWGGEALYNSHEDDPATAPVLAAIGTPVLIEADVPIEFLKNRAGMLPVMLVRRYLISRGFESVEPNEYDGRIGYPLPVENVRRIVRFPEPDFMTLTGCSTWARLLRVSSLL